jgi:hypothetical protein
MVVRRRDIPDYFTADFSLALRIWADYKKFGLPYAGGYARQPAQILALIRLFENEYTAWENGKTKIPTTGNVRKPPRKHK